MNANEPIRPLLTSSDVCEVLNISESTLRRLVRRHVIRPITFIDGGRWRFRPSDVERLAGAPPADEAELAWR